LGSQSGERTHTIPPLYNGLVALDGDSYHRLDAAFSGGDLEALRREIGDLGDFPNVAPDAAIGLPLVYAIDHSPLSLVRELLDAGADPNSDSGDGFPPLIAALTCATPTPGATVRQDVPELVELLLRRGADVEQRGLNDYTPLHLAAAQGDLAMVKLLLRHGADPNQITRIDDMETPLEVAERAGNRDVADRLRPLTTQLNWEQAAARGDVRVLRRMRRDGHDIDAKDGYGLTALMRAAHAGQREAVQWLVAEGANLDHTSKFRLSALMLAVIGNNDKIARMLVRAGADTSIKGTGAPGFAGKTAADLAEEAGATKLAADIRHQAR
jgi:ankyrin repeat protein